MNFLWEISQALFSFPNIPIYSSTSVAGSWFILLSLAIKQSHVAMEIPSVLAMSCQRAPAPAIPKIFGWKTHDVQMFDPQKKREKLKATWWLIPPPAWLPASHLLLSTRSSTSTAPENPADLNPTCLGIVWYSLWHHSKMVCLGLSGWIFVFAIHTLCRSSVLSLQLIHPCHSLMSQPPQNLRATSQMTPFQGNGHGPCGASHLLPPKISENQGLLTVAFVD